MTSARIEGVTLEYELAGTAGAPRVLVISGSGTDLRDPPQMQVHPRLADRFETLAYDHRGLGRSVPDEPEREPTMADLAADALALLDHVGWDTCLVFGVSFGGMVAQELAVTAPERVERLCLACTSPGGAGGSSAPLHELLDAPPAEALARRVKWLDTRTDDDPDLRALWMELMAGFADNEPTLGARMQLAARAHHDVWDRLPNLCMPVLIASGRYDGLAPPDNQEALRTAIPHAALQWFEGGHGFFIEDPDALPAIADWLAAE